MPQPVPPRPTPAPQRPGSGAGELARALAWGLLLSALAATTLGAPVAPGPAPTSAEAPAATALPGEFHRATVPHLALARQTARRGQWPLWNDRAGAGYPLLGTAESQLLHPFSLLSYPLPAAAWLPWLAFLRIVTGLGLAFALQRRLGAPAALALAGATAYACGVAALAAHPLATHAALAPGLLLAVDHLGRGFRNRHATLTLAFALVFAAGDPPGLALACLAATAFLAVVVAPRPPAVRRRRLAELVACGGLAALVTAPVLATTFRWYGATYPIRRFARQRAWGLTIDPLELEEGLGMTSQPVRLDVLAGPETPWLVVLGLALVALALAAWWQRRRPAAKPSGHQGRAAFFAGLGALAWLEVARPPAISSLFEFYHLPPAAELTAATGLPWLLLALAGLATAVAGRAVPRSPRWPAGALATAGVLTAIFLTLLPVLRQPTPPPRSEVVDFLQQRQSSHGYSRVAALGPLLPAETLARHGLSDVRGILDHLPADFVEVVPWIFEFPMVEAGAVPDRRTPAATFAASHSPMYRLLGVRWMVTEAPWPTDRPPPGRLAGEPGDLAVFESSDALPVLFLPRQVRTRSAPDGWLPWVRRNRDFRVRTLSQEPPRPFREATWLPPGTAAPPQEGALHLVTVESTRLTAEVTAERRRLVASSVYQDGGWHALAGLAGGVDGDLDRDLRPVPTVFANGPFVAAWLPPGRHRITFLYRPPGFLPGMAVAALGLALALVWLLPAPRRLRAADAGFRGAQ